MPPRRRMPVTTLWTLKETCALSSRAAASNPSRRHGSPGWARRSGRDVRSSSVSTTPPSRPARTSRARDRASLKSSPPAGAGQATRIRSQGRPGTNRGVWDKRAGFSRRSGLATEAEAIVSEDCWNWKMAGYSGRTAACLGLLPHEASSTAIDWLVLRCPRMSRRIRASNRDTCIWVTPISSPISCCDFCSKKRR
jgi:hypothetical protein